MDEDLRPLTNRQRLVALMDLEGADPHQISTATGLAAARIFQLQRSPLYQAYVSDLRSRLEAKRIDSLADMLRATAPKAVQRLEMLSENKWGDVPYQVQQSASAKLVDTALAVERHAADPETAKPQIILSGDAAARIAAMLLEAGMKVSQPRDITPLSESITVAESTVSVSDAVLAEQ